MHTRFVHRLALHYRLIALAAALAMLGGVAMGGLQTSTASAQMYYTYPTSYSAYYTPSYSPYYTYPSYSYSYPSYSYAYPSYSYSYPYYSYSYPYYGYSSYSAYPYASYYGNSCSYWGYAC